jgi:hypothetical protein
MDKSKQPEDSLGVLGRGPQFSRESFCQRGTFQLRSGEDVERVAREGNGLGKNFNLEIGSKKPAS